MKVGQLLGMCVAHSSTHILGVGKDFIQRKVDVASETHPIKRLVIIHRFGLIILEGSIIAMIL